MTLEAIVVLGCRVGPDGRPGGASGRRVSRAAEVWREHPGSLVLVSGGRHWGGVSEATAMREALVSEHQVPPEVVVSEDRSLSTAENARFSVELLHGRGIRRMGIVTCDWHLPRALANFRAVGAIPVGLAAPSPAVSPRRRLWRTARERAAALLDRWTTRGWSRW